MQWSESNGIALRYHFRAGSGPTLVLLHEMGGSLDSWRDVIDLLPESVQVLSYDMRCAGQSEKLTGAMHIDAHVDDLKALLAELKVDGPLALVGVAVGAAVAIRFAAIHGQRVSHLVALAPACGVIASARERAQQVVAQIRGSGLRGVFLGLLDRGWPELMRNDTVRFASFRGRCLGNDPLGFSQFFEMLLGLNLEADLGRLPNRSVLVAGIYDELRPPQEIQRLSGFAPGVEWLDVASGHFMQVQSPRWVATLLKDFIFAEMSAQQSYQAFTGDPKNLTGVSGHVA